MKVSISDFPCKDCKLFFTRNAPWAKNIEFLSGRCLATDKAVSSGDIRKCLISTGELVRNTKAKLEEKFKRVKDEFERLEWVISVLEDW